MEHIDEKFGKGLMADFIPIYRFVYKIYKTQTVRDMTEFMEKFTNYMRDLMETKKKGFDEGMRRMHGEIIIYHFIVEHLNLDNCIKSSIEIF